MTIESANVGGRIAGALLGYWLNGKLTFAGDEHAIGGTQLRRYLLMWLGTTLARMWSLGAIDHGLGRGSAWLLETRNELVPGVVGFRLSRIHRGYRKFGLAQRIRAASQTLE